MLLLKIPFIQEIFFFFMFFANQTIDVVVKGMTTNPKLTRRLQGVFKNFLDCDTEA